MSYYIGVWEGPAPLSNVHAGSEFQRRMAERSQAEPTPGIRQFVEGLLDIHPDIDRPEGADGPWADAPLIQCIDGSTAYLPVRQEWLDEVAALVQERVAGREFVAFDPQAGALVPSATAVARTSEFELPPPAELPIHLGAVLGEAMAAGRSLAGVLEQGSTQYYVQWLVRDGRLTIEAQGDGRLPESLRLSGPARAQMLDLGFQESDPNWQLRWADGQDHVEEAATLLGRVLTEVRGIPVGEIMRLQTFPV